MKTFEVNDRVIYIPKDRNGLPTSIHRKRVEEEPDRRAIIVHTNRTQYYVQFTHLSYKTAMGTEYKAWLNSDEIIYDKSYYREQSFEILGI